MHNACIGIVVLGSALAQVQEPVILENAWIRIELEPRTFSVRFLGFPGGKNFLEPAHLTETEVAGRGWLEPGGITSDLLPVEETNAMLRRGPAEVVERRDDYALLLGPEHPERHWRIKKEYQLAPDMAEVRYKLTVLSSEKDERRAAVRVTAQVPEGGRLLVPRAYGTLGLLGGEFPNLVEVLAEGGEHVAVYMTSKTGFHQALLTAPAPEATVSAPFGQWRRRMELLSAAGDPEEQGRHRLLALLDSETHTWQIALEATQDGVNVGAPLVVVETWTLGPAETAPPPEPDTP